MNALKKISVGGFIRKNPVLVGSIVLVLLLSTYYGFRYGATAEAEEQLVTVSDEADRLALNLKNSSQLPEQMAAIDEAMVQINSKVMQSSALAINLQFFYKVVSDTGTKLIELRQGSIVPTTKKDGGFIPVPFVVSVQGEYPKVMAFLQSLESGAYITRIATITMAPVPGNSLYEDSGTEMITLSVNLEVLGVQ